MLTINKINTSSPIDYAAEELKKYLRMMMPECGDVKISYNPSATEGFRLGLMSDFGLDTSDASDEELDDVLYIDCDAKGGIIAGSNPRSVLFSVYEYLRQNGCRWLLPGVDGELIPMKDIAPVKYRHKPSCRHRGHATEGCCAQHILLDVIDYLPKVGLNTFMIEFKVPREYYSWYYTHLRNEENRPPEPVSNTQVLQWKRQLEHEIVKRGLQYHGIGHGLTVDPFGIDSAIGWSKIDEESLLTDETRQYLAVVDGKRGLFRSSPCNTNFCMSNHAARKIVTDYIASYAKRHTDMNYIHVWLADSFHNHCECEECRKKTPSDWYIVLLNDIDRALTEEDLPTKIVFISYVDTTWAPLTERIKNPSRFTFLFAPIFRSYTYSLKEEDESFETVPYELNKSDFPRTLAASLKYYRDWQKFWHGSTIAFEYHFWRFAVYDVSTLEMARRVYDDIKIYKENGMDGIIENGTQRSFFPTGLLFYVYARTLYDTSLSFETIVEDYFSSAFGEDFRDFIKYFEEIKEAIPFEYYSIDEAKTRENVYYDPKMAKSIARLYDIADRAKAGIIKKNYNSEYRLRTVSVRLIEHHTEFLKLLADWMIAKAKGESKERTEFLFNRFRIEFGKRECEIEKYFDMTKISPYIEALNSPTTDTILVEN